MATIKALVEQLNEALAKEDGTQAGTTGAAAGNSIQVLRASQVEVPMAPSQPLPMSPEFIRIRADFIAGKELSPADLRRIMIRAAEGGGNGNCGLC
jgi:hypothetical protein